jgi:hypothetical protein
MKIAIAIASIKGFDLRGDQEVALPGVADALAQRGMADSIQFMQRV